jgi:predicted ATPase
MLINRLRVSGLLSFGPQGIDLPMGNLNVLIGPNGSGKSNLLEVLALLKAASTNLPAPVKEMGGVREWLWKGALDAREATVEATLAYPSGRQPLRHGLVITDHGGRFEVVDEWIENEKPYPGKPGPLFFYRFQRGNPVLKDMQGQERQLQRVNVKPEQSVLSQIRDSERYPVLDWLQGHYERIGLFRNWSFGPNASLRREQSTHDSGDFLADGGQNLSLVMSQFPSEVKARFVAFLKELYGEIEDYRLPIIGANVLLHLEEQGGRSIPATRLSDGTLRYLCLLAILLHPDPPPLIAIEEPELGLHPDIIPQVAKLLVAASERTQLVITTHSDALVDMLSSQPESVIVCEKADGESQFRRLEREPLREWLEKYTLGQLWSMGEIGGNRW